MKLRNPTIYTSIFFFQSVEAGFRHAPSGSGEFSYNCPIGIVYTPFLKLGHIFSQGTMVNLVSVTNNMAGVILPDSLTVPISLGGNCGQL